MAKEGSMKMWIKAELKCLNCSRFLGEVEGPEGSTLRLAPQRERATQAPVVRCGPTSFCCGRCGGRAIVEEWERVSQPRTARARQLAA